MPRRRDTKRGCERRSFLQPAPTVVSGNVERFSTAKHVLGELCSNLQCDVLCLQETHRGSDNPRPVLPGMVLAIKGPHRQYGGAIFTKTSCIVKAATKSDASDIEVLPVEQSSVVVTSVYKPLSVDFNFSQPVPLAHKLRSS